MTEAGDDMDDDYKSLFFEECQDLLIELQDLLNQLRAGDAEDETVNAAFRAVHSIKGGAAAFGVDALGNFAHVFETVMDRLRSKELSATGEVMQTLLRAADVMAALVEATQANAPAPADDVARSLEDLASLSGVEVPQTTQDEGEQPTDEDEEKQEGGGTIIVRVDPGPDFLSSGHDPLRMVRAARDIGAMLVSVSGVAPRLADMDAARCPFIWEMTFPDDLPRAELDEFFEVYDLMARVTIQADALDSAPKPQTSGTPVVDDVTPQSPGAPGKASRSLRVDLDRIDKLVNLVGEMLITQAGLSQRMSDTGTHDMGGATHTVDALARQLRELQEQVMRIRAQPVKAAFSRLPRMVRDLSEKLGKNAELDITGEATEVDTTIIEELSEPLIHLLRNAMDHGVEAPSDRAASGKPQQAKIRLKAEHRGERVVFTIEDDGRGIDRSAVLRRARERGLVATDSTPDTNEIDALIFNPGFSTAETVSDVSGRGVGMDVVRKKIQSLGGRIHVSSTPGEGTRFTMTLPLTLAVMDGMAVMSGAQQFIVPLSSVIEAVRIGNEESRVLPDGTPMIRHRGTYLRRVDLHDVLSLQTPEHQTDMAIIVEDDGQGAYALTVDRVLGQRQVVLKSLAANLHQIDGVSGATIMGNGQVALILDAPALPGLYRRHTQTELIH